MNMLAGNFANNLVSGGTRLSFSFYPATYQLPTSKRARRGADDKLEICLLGWAGYVNFTIAFPINREDGQKCKTECEFDAVKNLCHGRFVFALNDLDRNKGNLEYTP